MEAENRKSPNTRAQEAWEASAALGREILQNARNELYLNMRFLDLALSGLSLCPVPGEGPLYTDGRSLYFHPESMAALYLKGRVLVNRAYLHVILHCLFCHLYGRRGRAREYWNLACDVAAESILDGLYTRCVHVQPKLYRVDIYERLRRSCRVLNAESIYRALQEMDLSERQYERMVLEFAVDDHREWERPKGPKTPQQDPKRDWDEKREKLQTELETYGKEAGEEARGLLEQVQIENRERYDYKKFLRRFSVLKETMRVDLDSFDYIYYHYGMDLYGNMPLIEHLETREEKRIEDFVIVIDTSLSCSGELVRKFLTQTYAVLTETESFFRKINIHILQCDERVHSDRLITDAAELAEYMEHMEIIGQGGTDFRPAFRYVEELLQRRVFQKLRGLIYFTDGYGIYPTKMPAYETAFVFLAEDYCDLEVPPWAIKLILTPEEL